MRRLVGLWLAHDRPVVPRHHPLLMVRPPDASLCPHPLIAQLVGRAASGVETGSGCPAWHDVTPERRSSAAVRPLAQWAKIPLNITKEPLWRGVYRDGYAAADGGAIA